MNNFVYTIVVAAIFFILGAALVGALWYFKGVSARARNGSKGAASEEANLSEVIRLMRHLQTQELVVQIEGKNFNHASELTPAQNRRVNFTSNVLSKWLSQDAQTPALGEEASIAPGAPVNGDIEQVKPVSTHLTDVVSEMLSPTPAPIPTTNSIAKQINDILQAQMVGTPLVSRGITLADAPGGGVIVTLDGKQYDGLMDVPDREVLNAIRLAVKEWETRK